MNASSSSSSGRTRMPKSNLMNTNAVYFPSDQVYSGNTPGMLNYACINQVYYAYAHVAADGGVYLNDEWADARAPVDGVLGALGSLMHLRRKYKHLRVLLSIGGGNSNDHFPTVASSPILRDVFARSALGLVEASGLDGIDICWEYPSDAQQGYDFLALLAAIRIHLPAERFLLSAMLPASVAILQFIDWRATSDYLDFLNLMAFDFVGVWSPRTGHQAQLFPVNRDETSGSTGVSYLAANGFDVKKIILGIPTHGRSFLHATGPGQKFRGGGGLDGSFTYTDLPRKGCKEVVDKRYAACFSVGGDGGFVTYDNPETVKMKANWCKQKGLGGLYYWNGPADSKDKSRSLIAAGFRALHSG